MTKEKLLNQLLFKDISTKSRKIGELLYAEF